MNQDQIFFGSAYYREYLPYERLDQDIALMKKAHFNYVRIGESTWSTYEPVDGKFDFTPLITVLDRMHENGIKVIVGTPTYAVPAWLTRKHPEVLAQTLNGQNKYGARQLMDITAPAYRYYAQRIVTKMLEAVHDHPAIIGYQIDNETKYYGCVSSNLQYEFVSYLKEKFQGDLDQLNHAFGLDYWSNRINTWEDFPDVSATINGSLNGAFQTFQRLEVTRWLNTLAELVRPFLREGQFITHNFDFEWRDYSFGVQPDVNHFEAAAPLDVVGVDIYHPSQECLTGKEIAFGGDEMRSIKDQRYFVLETEAQAFKNWTPFPGQLFLQAMAHVASGARMISYWHWHSLHNSFESYWKGLLSHDLEPNPVYDAACTIGAALQQLEPELKGFTKDNQVCLVVSNECLTAIDNFPYRGPSLHTVNFKEHLYNDVVRKYYDALYEHNIETDIRRIEDDRIFDGRYQLLVLPLLYTVSDERLQKIKNFVAHGGHVLFSFKSAVADENVKIRTTRQPGLITDILGVSYQLVAEPHNLKLVSEQLDLSNTDCTCHDFMELVTVANPKTEVLARYDHRYYHQYAAISYLKQDHGGNNAGSAAYIASDVSSEVIGQVLEHIIAANGLLPERTQLRFPLVVRCAKTGDSRTVRFILNFSEHDQSVVNPGKTATSLLDGRTIGVGESFTLKDWGCAILKEQA